jgi:hypothetical protein
MHGEKCAVGGEVKIRSIKKTRVVIRSQKPIVAVGEGGGLQTK